MQVDSAFLRDLRGLLQRPAKDNLRIPTPLGFSVGAVVQLAVLLDYLPPRLGSIIEQWSGECVALGNAIFVHRSGTPPVVSKVWEPHALEFFPIRGLAWMENPQFHTLQSRFVKGARNVGFGNLADAFAGAMREMADNVTQHSGTNSASPEPGLLGYHVSKSHLTFTIADAGRGVLASLKDNPSWEALSSSKEALMAVTTKQASRRPGLGGGEGFKTIFQSIANLNGTVEFFSGDGFVRIIGTQHGRTAFSQFIGSAPGFQLTITCTLTGNGGERVFPVDYLT